MILVTVAAACLVPTCICVILAIRYDRLKSAYDQNKADLEWYRDRFGDEMSILAGGSEEVNTSDKVVSDSEPLTEEFETDYSDIYKRSAEP